MFVEIVRLAISRPPAVFRSRALSRPPHRCCLPLLLVSRWRCCRPLASLTSQVIAAAATMPRPDRAKELVVHEVRQVQHLVHLQVGSGSCVQEHRIRCLLLSLPRFNLEMFLCEGSGDEKDDGDGEEDDDVDEDGGAAGLEVAELDEVVALGRQLQQQTRREQHEHHPTATTPWPSVGHIESSISSSSKRMLSGEVVEIGDRAICNFTIMIYRLH
jgi:hypothetical protein